MDSTQPILTPFINPVSAKEMTPMHTPTSQWSVNERDFNNK
uniref:Uncharacterized protein n=1 Tax=Anguilla anguilla TaxID=7936 RepID=A0A0E9UB52_ANGAN